MHRPDRIRLQHMLDAAREAIASVQGRVRADLDHDRIWALGLVKCIEIIGEAAARVTPEARSQFPDGPPADFAPRPAPRRPSGLVSASTGCGKTAPVHRLPREGGEAGVPGARAFGKI